MTLCIYAACGVSQTPKSKVMAKEIVGDKFEIGEYRYQKAVYKVEK